MKKYFFLGITILATSLLLVIGCDSTGNSGDDVITDSTAPAEVTNLSADSVYREATLKWTNPDDSDFDQCQVWYGTGDTADTEFTGTVSSSGTIITGLDERTEYTFTVKTEDTSGNVSSGTHTTATTNGQIAFVSDRDDAEFEIYVMEPDGSNISRLTTNSFTEAELSWSPDGSKIAYRSNEEGNEDIYVMNSDGSNPVNITNTADEEATPQWSPDGNKIVFQRNGELFTISPDGTDETQVTSTDAGDNVSNPSWSEDSSQIAFISDESGSDNIYVMDADDFSTRTMVPNTENAMMPLWNGPKILYFSDEDADSDYVNNYYDLELVAIDPDGNNKEVLVDDGDDGTADADTVGVDGAGNWSYNNEYITFVSNRDGNVEIYRMDADGTNQTRVTNNANNDGAAIGVLVGLTW